MGSYGFIATMPLLSLTFKVYSNNVMIGLKATLIDDTSWIGACCLVNTEIEVFYCY